MLTVEALSNRDEWQRFVASCTEGTIFHTLEWKEVLERSFDVESLYLVFRKPDGEMVGLCPFVIWKEFKFVKVADSLKNSDFGGPLLRDGYEAAVAEALLNFLGHLAHDRGVIYARIRFPTRTLSNHFNVAGSKEETGLGTMSLSVRMNPTDVIWREVFDGHTRRKIKRVYRDGYAAAMAESLQDVQQFYDLYCENMARIGVNSYPFAFFKNLYDSFYPDRFNILLVKRNQEHIAGLGFFAHEPTKTVYTNYVGYRTSPYSVSDFLNWELMQWAERSGYEHFNRGSTPSDPEEIHHRQKASIGAKFNQDYVRILPLNRLGFLAREFVANSGKAVLPRMPKSVRRRIVEMATT